MGKKIFLTTYISANCGLREMKFFCAVRDLGGPFILNFKTLALKLGRGEMIVEMKKFAFLDKKGIFQIYSQKRVLKLDKL